LAQVTCHGDCHGGNTFMTDAPNGGRQAAFFDFDDAGPGYLAYDLAVYLWACLLQTEMAASDADLRERWTHYIEGYRRRRAIADVDYQAIAAFVSLRHFWFMGEYASRVPEWGTEAFSTAWLRRQVKLLDKWATLVTPEI
jgi:Ser/Thr protein kinase RdoA (MazF antagonist)